MFTGTGTAFNVTLLLFCRTSSSYYRNPTQMWGGTAKALNLNLPIYQKGPDVNIQVIEQTRNTRAREVHLKFPTNLFINITPEWVEDLPHDIDDIMIYKMKCLPREWVQKTWDLRYFRMYSLRRKGLIGTRKVGRCIGKLYCPFDNCHFKLSTGRKRNTSDLQNVDGHEICCSCGQVANREWSGGTKMIDYCRESEILTIYHIS